jgi:hypothetical protein
MAFELQLSNQQENDHLQNPMAAKRRGGKISQFSGIDRTIWQTGSSFTRNTWQLDQKWHSFPIFQAVVGASILQLPANPNKLQQTRDNQSKQFLNCKFPFNLLFDWFKETIDMCLSV